MILMKIPQCDNMMGDKFLWCLFVNSTNGADSSKQQPVLLLCPLSQGMQSSLIACLTLTKY